MSLLTVKNLSVGYDSHVILKDLSFKVEAGDYLCIIGENGSGKTTLMRTLLGLIPSLSGSISLDEELTGGGIGYLPQKSSIQKDFPASVTEIVLSGFLGGMGRAFFYTKEQKTLALENLERMGIKELKDRSFSELSGGQQQRVMLARALCATKALLLMDEPVAGLDPDAQNSMYSVIQKLNKEGCAIIMISHDVDAAMRYADHILRTGPVPFFGTKEEYLKNE
ncbi:MAG: ABC transporter ATP-binding protein [Lachnospiraceae bacterium]|nr:ABC transporter ATP-binding protein [Lachnospiraceae bacterium]